MLKRVISYPNGNIIFYHHDRRITVSNGGNSVTDIIMYNKKEADGLVNGSRALYGDITISRRDELYDFISAFDRVTGRNH